MLVDRPVEHVVVLTLNRPDRLNPVGGELTEALTKIWPELDADPTVRVIILTGAGRGFCSGADLERRAASDGASRLTGEADPIERRGIRGYQGPGARAYPRFTARQAHVSKPVITAVNGVCAGAGLHFVADSDMVSEVVPHDDLMDRAIAIAQAVATASPATLQTSLRSIWESLEYPLTESYYHAFGPLTAHWEHPDAQEGPRAFMEKRDPAWAE